MTDASVVRAFSRLDVLDESWLYAGTGKSYLAKALRDVEVMNGGDPPRVFALDDYFTAEDDDDEEEVSDESRE